MPKTQLPSPLLNILQTRVLPVWQQHGMERCLIAPHDLKNARTTVRWMASGAKISRCDYRGPRVAVKGPRHYGNRSMISASWPQDHLVARRSTIIVFVIGGHADLRVGDKILHCSTGHSIVLLPGTPQPDGLEPHLMEENRETGQCEVLWISGSLSGLSCWICHSQNKRHFELPGESCYFLEPGVKIIFEEFIREASEHRRDFSLICQYLFQALLVAMCREISEAHLFQFNYQKAEASPEFVPDRLENPIAAAQEYIKNHLHEPLQIDEMARRFLLSRTEFTQHFKRETGKTFKEYLTNLRMEEACNLLQNTSWSIEKIARAVSFQSSRLRFLFNRHYNISPQEFRAQARQSKPASADLTERGVQ